MSEAYDRNPLIFIPGLMGSMGDDIIKGMGQWGFGMATLVYKPLINGLEKMGYSVGQDLFICYYDWRKTIKTTIELYLKPLIKEIKETYPNRKIDIIGHSMGGLVARSLIQDYNYGSGLVDKLILIGTPNRGAVSAYYFWSTGSLLKNKRGNNFINLIVHGYIWIMFSLMGIAWGRKDLRIIQENFPGIGELIPSYDYGNILYYKDPEDSLLEIPKANMKYQNSLLNKLNYNLEALFVDDLSLYNIVGYDFYTPEALIIDGNRFLYEHEEIVLDAIETLAGDGTVTMNSALLTKPVNYHIQANHKNMVKESLNKVGDILGIKTIQPLDGITIGEDLTLHILFTGQANFVVSNGGRPILEFYGGQIISQYSYIYETYPKAHNWIVIKDIPRGQYSINIDNHQAKNLQIFIMSEKLKDMREKQEILAYQKDYIHYFTIG